MTEQTTKTRPKSQQGAQSKTQKPLRIGLDDGYAQTKLYGEGPDGKLIQKIIRSSARAGKFGLTGLGGDASAAAYEVPGSDGRAESFTVSDRLDAEDTKFDGFHTSGLNRVLVQHALIDAGYGDRSVKLGTGLPVSDYFRDGKRDTETLEQKRENLMGPVTPVDDRAAARVEDVAVGSQAVAAFFDFAMNDDLTFRDDVDTEMDVAIVDIGGRTTDVAVIVGGADIDQARSGTRNTGVLNVYDDVAVRVREAFGIRDTLPPHIMDAAVRNRSIKLWGKSQDISETVDAVVAEYENQLTREIERKLGGAAQVGNVVFVGGGANLFGTIAERFPNGVFLTEPEMANARGLYKFLKLKDETA